MSISPISGYNAYTQFAALKKLAASHTASLLRQTSDNADNVIISNAVRATLMSSRKNENQHADSLLANQTHLANLVGANLSNVARVGIDTTRIFNQAWTHTSEGVAKLTNGAISDPTKLKQYMVETGMGRSELYQRVLDCSIEDTLSKGGITIEEGETFNISVDMHCNVTVTGDNAEKAKAIQDLLNSVPGGINWGLTLQQHPLNRNGEYSPGDSDIWPNVLNKMYLENYINTASGGAVSLSDLYVENGRIMGLPPELDEIINSIEPIDPYAELDIPYYKNPNVKSPDVKTILLEILRIGVDNIPDKITNAILGKGSIKIL